MSETHGRRRLLAALAWPGLFALAVALGFVFSVIQPPGGPGDEDAHVRYIRFLADEQRLPVWEPSGGGEAGYEAQHPPLYCAAGALVYELTSELPENWRWYALRWYTLALGLALFLIARGFCLEYFHGRQGPAIAAAAAFALTPTTLLHVSYINVDLASVLMCSVVIWMCLRATRKPPSFDPAPWICGITFLTLCIGHQGQVWFSDYEFNAGGRYLLNGLMGAYALMISGLYALPARRAAVTLLVAVALAANAVAVVRIWTVLNPRHYPEWRLFELTPQGDPGMGDSSAVPQWYAAPPCNHPGGIM